MGTVVCRSDAVPLFCVAVPRDACSSVGWRHAAGGGPFRRRQMHALARARAWAHLQLAGLGVRAPQQLLLRHQRRPRLPQLPLELRRAALRLRGGVRHPPLGVVPLLLQALLACRPLLLHAPRGARLLLVELLAQALAVGLQRVEPRAGGGQVPLRGRQVGADAPAPLLRRRLGRIQVRFALQQLRRRRL